MSKKNVNPVKLLSWFVVILLMAAILVFVNRKSFRNQTTVPDTVVEQLDFPLNKVTVGLKKKEFMSVLKNCTWIDASNNLGNSISINPAQGEEAKFDSLVNQYGNAERLANLYKSHGFKWDAARRELTLPVNGSSVSVPSWPVFQLVGENLFTVDSTAQEQ